MKVSARNQFLGTVSAINIGAVNAEVNVSLASGIEIVASITKESVHNLGIQTGITAIALVKAPQIILVTDFGGYKLSARNQLAGKVNELKRGQVNAEVDILLAGGELVATTITNDSVDQLNLSVGQTVTVVFKASAVVLGIAE